MAFWRDLAIKVDALTKENDGLRFRLHLKEEALKKMTRDRDRLRAALELVHSDADEIVQVTAPALVVVKAS